MPLLPIPVSPKPRADPKLSRTIVVAGCIAAPDDFVDLWRGLSSIGSERFSLVWETKELIALNKSITDMLLSQVMTHPLHPAFRAALMRGINRCFSQLCLLAIEDDRLADAGEYSSCV